MNKTIIAATCLAFGSILFTQCKDTSSEEKVLTKKVAFKKEGTLLLKKAATDSVIARLDIEIADDDYQTQTGLMYRTTMQQDRGMLFIFEDERPRSFYMKNTQFALDIIYLDADQKVVSIQKNAQPMDPTSLPSEGDAMYVLEVNAGLSDQWNLQKGDHMSFVK
ncbi:DUF192 domain-containing protein [Altibacter sp. HG106]|uniref:DUF192 domain-containing protein n=1 Tax=Altibacter sp. HG106 TaxID=3023937 RepID=UPI00234FD39F|nr:DUF192 domain-containing protein [Altibacter sp. HG106]MDC7996067.1 DUF192 domain-containing protein [Altibacter sp. HG106]